MKAKKKNAGPSARRRDVEKKAGGGKNRGSTTEIVAVWLGVLRHYFFLRPSRPLGGTSGDRVGDSQKEKKVDRPEIAKKRLRGGMENLLPM